MRAFIILLVLGAGLVGALYFVLNPSKVYENAAAVPMTEIVIDDGESTLKEKFSKDLMNETISVEELVIEEFEETERTTASENIEAKTEGEEEVEVEEVPEIVPQEQKEWTLPLYDGHVSSEPDEGYVYLCEAQTEREQIKKPWIQGEVWYPNLKLKVSGDVYRKNAEFISEVQGDVRTLAGNGLPNHATGDFPAASDSRVYPYTEDRYSVRTQILGLTIPANPIVAESPTCLPVGEIGVMLSGASLYSAVLEGGFDAGAHAIEDTCGGLPDRAGKYHYHRESKCVVEDVNGNQSGGTLIGYALDGFGIYASVEFDEKVTNSNLDACHGHTHEMLWNGEEVKMYHYHATDEFPYTLGCFKGSPIPR
jgi:hypothetical protein